MPIENIECTNENFVQKSVDWIANAIKQSLEKNGECILGLSGGGTPLPIYTELGKREDVDWTKVKLFMVDERHVPDNHADSNLRNVFDTLLKPGLIPNANLVFPKVNEPYAECLEDYDKQIKELIKSSQNGKVSIVILGLGDDGHFASLFPHSSAELFKSAFDPAKYVIGTTTDVFAVHNRITTTYPVLANAESSVFLLKGQSKLDVFNATVNSTEDYTRWPAKPVVEKVHTTAIYTK